ncbi:hypothetical protein RCZ04_18930 [Capnocytophaga sp. HP1101]
MKKLFILSLASLGFIACGKRADYILLSGKIEGANGIPLELRIVGGEVDQPLHIKPDGTFQDTLRVPSNYYTIFNPQGIQIPLYLEQGDELGVNINLTKMPLEVKFSGKDTLTNAYLHKKADLTMEIQKTGDLEKLLGKAPAEFKTGVDEYNKKYTDLLKNTKKLSKDFIKKEEKAINYEMLYLKSIYKKAHLRLTQEEVELPKEFADELSKLDYDLADDYNTYRTYKELVTNNLFDKFEDKEDSENPWGKIIAHVKGLKSQNIKTDLSRYFISGVSVINTPEDNAELIKSIRENVKDTAALKELDRRIAVIERLKPGSDFPAFTAEDIKGKPVSYESLKDKLLYIDIWATWCKPCIKEMPSMKALQEAYKGKAVTFVAISVDQDKEAWKAMVQREKMGGIQLYTNLSVNRDFVDNYDLTGIPRFMLVKNGKIISISAPRPSDAKIKELINANL